MENPVEIKFTVSNIITYGDNRRRIELNPDENSSNTHQILSKIYIDIKDPEIKFEEGRYLLNITKIIEKSPNV